MPAERPTLSTLIARNKAHSRLSALGLDRRALAAVVMAGILGVALVAAALFPSAVATAGIAAEAVAPAEAPDEIVQVALAGTGVPAVVEGPPEDPFAPGRWQRRRGRRLATLPAPDVLHALTAGALTPRFETAQPVPPTPYGELIYRTASRHRMNPLLVAAVVWTESAFDPHAVSARDARGLMQVTPATGERFGLRTDQLFDPARNLDAGVRYLRWLTDRFDDDLDRILAAYNAGEAAVDRHGGIPPFAETRDYLRRVYARLGQVPAER